MAATRPALMAGLHVDEEEVGRMELTRAGGVWRRLGMPPGTVEVVQRRGKPAETILAVAAERGAQIVAIGHPNRPGRLAPGGDSDAVLAGRVSGGLRTGEAPEADRVSWPAMAVRS